MRGLSAFNDPRDLSAFAFLHQPDAENSPHLPIDDTFIQIKQKKEGFYWKSYKKLTLWKDFRVFSWSF